MFRRQEIRVSMYVRTVYDANAYGCFHSIAFPSLIGFTSTFNNCTQCGERCIFRLLYISNFLRFIRNFRDADIKQKCCVHFPFLRDKQSGMVQKLRMQTSAMRAEDKITISISHSQATSHSHRLYSACTMV